MITTICFYQDTSGKWHVSRLQPHTKTGWTWDHPVNSCLCATVDSRALPTWQQDEATQIGTWSWRTEPLDIQSAAYINRWVNGSIRVGQDWCKRVRWQAAISGPKMSYARFQWHISAVRARRLRIPSPRRSRFLSAEAERPYRHGNDIAKWAQEPLNILLFLMGLQGPSKHTYTQLNRER